MMLVGHQPEYLPYVGFFNKIMHADKFVLVDHVQFNKKNWQNRNKIRTASGWCWLTVPVYSKHKMEQRIDEVEINNEVCWKDKHWKSIYLNYKSSPYFSEYSDFFREVYQKNWIKLRDLNETIIKYLLQKLEINIEIYRSSELNIEGKKTDLIVDLCKKLRANAYISGSGGKEYVDAVHLKQVGISSYFRNMKTYVYKQQFESFEPHMSVIDLLFNCGVDESRKIIYDCGELIL